MILTQELIKSILSYDESTGEFRWLSRDNDPNLTDKQKLAAKNRQGKKAGGVRVDKQKKKHYEIIKIYGRNYRVHKIAYLYCHGYMPAIIDHINHNTIDNRIENLREISKKDNSRNLPLYSNNKTGYHGVYPCATGYRAVIGVDGKVVHIGTFPDLGAAVSARKQKEAELGFMLEHGK
tara:strand:- start:141 stop:674 length:534 start_codon:yes stop_codon:yes gene_type:complete